MLPAGMTGGNLFSGTLWQNCRLLGRSSANCGHSGGRTSSLLQCDTAPLRGRRCSAPEGACSSSGQVLVLIESRKDRETLLQRDEVASEVSARSSNVVEVRCP